MYGIYVLILFTDLALPANKVCGLHDLPWGGD